ncbi:major facilitator superfamily domain-containing protein [Thelonectria olida]|uniref:Major facilitator superfamily domain-containing protein n=1 Tax=Thelonectria olida TaxID=1576542 RepID=A0A9P9AKY4_9HYPO|nr:major facilitator superfamily domain-containing protein [Thelonectria olida]
MAINKEISQPDLVAKSNPVVEITEPVIPDKIPFFRGTTFQALVVAFLFFSGPGMISALGAVGAGGLKDPLLVNITNGMQYGMNCLFAFFAGVVVNLIGVRGALSFGLLCFPIRGAALYCANKFKTVWFMYFASAVGGLTSSILWVVTGAIVLSYPEPSKKGFFISSWYNSLSLGTLLGGIIALAFNTTRNTAGSISPITYIPLYSLSSAAPILAWLLSPPEKVVRADGQPVKMNRQAGPWAEAKRTFSSVRRREIILLLPMFTYSQWYLSYHGNFNAVYHSVRGRALGGLLHSITGILGNISFWYMTDRTGWTRSQVARRGYYIIFTLYTISWIYNIVVQKLYTDWSPVGLDWVEGDYWLSIILYVFWQYANDMYQCYVYFLIGTLSTEVEELARYTGILKTVNTAGAAFGYAVQVKWNMLGAASLLTGLWFAQIIPTWLVVREVSDQEPTEERASSASGSSPEIRA